MNDEQHAAIEHNGSTVVLAGPGSGKTHTLVEKVCHLLEHHVPEPHSVACLTFNTDAVNEFTVRLRTRGQRPGRRLFLGTVHGFCLTRVIRPYGHLTDRPTLRDHEVLSAKGQLTLRQQALDMRGVNEDARWFDTTLTRIRKDLACDDDLSAHDERHIEVARQYEALLSEHRLIDFDAMTFEALRIIDQDPAIADLIVSRFPWIAVDEYQDLGGALHRIVMALRAAGSHVFAVGDPDQCIYEFSGAKPATVSTLIDAEDFHTIQLRYNYRSGSRLIDAAETALAQTRNYEPDPSRVDLGEVTLTRCAVGLDAQADLIVSDTIPTLIDKGVPLHEIAILYPGKGILLDAVAAALERSGIPFRLEREGAFPALPIIRWLQRCATRALNPREEDAESMADLGGPLLFLVGEAGAITDQTELRSRAGLYSALDASVVSDDPLGPWLTRVTAELDLIALLTTAGRPDEVEVLAAVIADVSMDGEDAPTVSDFASGAAADGRVVVTTYHSSKGRQFDVVLLPGMQNTLVPRTRWNPGKRALETTNMSEERRLFYVALTRSRYSAVLYYSSSFTNKNGYPVNGHSIFIDEIAGRFGVTP